MKQAKYTKWFTGAMMTAALAAGISSCSDDHFEVSSDVAGKSTIWQSIKSNDKLSDFAGILEQVKYSTSEEKTTVETYADVLNGDQSFTVWAPINGSFDAAYYNGLLASGIRDSIYKVEVELIRNNMTRYARVMNGSDSVKINLFNSKAAWLNNKNQTMKSSNIITPNVSVSNGALHIIDKPIEYQPNIYEFLATRPDISNINEFIKHYQKTEFNEMASIAGPTVNGEATWVDSVTYISNEYTTGFMNAHLTREDSNYVMVIPTNTAWDNILAKTSKYFVYKSAYQQKIHTVNEKGSDDTVEGPATKFTEAELDSITNLQSKNAICQDLVFNANWQYDQAPITTHADVAKADSLHSTAGQKFKPIGTLNETNTFYTVETDFNTIFGDKDPIELSNGYAYLVDEFTYPSCAFAPTLRYDPQGALEIENAQCESSRQTKTYKTDLDGNKFENDTTYKYTNFVMKNKSAGSQPGAYFKLTGVLSCKYNIYVVISYNTDAKLQNKFNVNISYDDADKRNESKVLKNPCKDDSFVDLKDKKPLGGTNYFMNHVPDYDAEGNYCYTDTILVAEDFEFPVCYRGLSTAYPVLEIKSNFKTTEKSFYAREIWVNAIILEPKEW